MALGQAYADTFAPLVWQAARREHFVEDTQAMRRRVEQSLPARQAGRELKLGPGGLRDIEFAVQLLQLVHGRTDETLRAPATLPALAALAAGGYVGRADADELSRRLPVPAPHRAPAPAAPPQPDPHPARGSRRTSQAGPGDAIF